MVSITVRELGAERGSRKTHVEFAKTPIEIQQYFQGWGTASLTDL